ncbi:MAG: PKD domain-containing protein [Thermoplasmata archaeon]
MRRRCDLRGDHCIRGLTALLLLSLCLRLPVEGAAPYFLSSGDGVPGLLEWASAQPRSFTPEGEELPFSGTPYFLKYHPDWFEDRDGGGGAALDGRYNSQLKKTGTYCRIYIDVDSVSPVPNDTILQSIADEFDTVIWPNDTATFGSPGYSVIDLIFYYMDGPGGLGGYYSGGNDLYIDSADKAYWYEIIAHEFQHCIHRARDSDESSWVNEGCSDLAIELCYGTNASYLRSHISSFAGNPNNDLTQFDSAGYDYGSAYAFLSYFHEHYGGRSAIYALVGDPANSITGFNNRLSGTGKDFNRVFREWTVANYMDNVSIDPVYGYANLSIRVAATQVRDYPYTGRGTVNSWAALYYVFTASGADLEVDFYGADGAPLEVYVGKIGMGDEPSGVERISLDPAKDGRFTVAGMGINYSSAVMVVSSGASRGEFSFDATIIDTYPPVTYINITPPEPNCPDGWYTTPPEISLSASEAGSSIFFRWDNGPPREYAFPVKAPEGEHIFSFRSRDPAGNMEEERSVTIRVDTTPPVTELVVDPPLPDGKNGWYLSPPNITLRTEERATTIFRWDSGPECNFSGPITAPEGVHTLSFRSIDVHGNREVERNATFLLDTVAPSSWIVLDPRSPNGLNGFYTTVPSIRIETEAGGELFYSWDGEPENLYVSTMKAREGIHTFSYWAVDTAGNREEAHTLELKVDTIAPVARASISPPEPDGAGGVYVSPVTVTITTDPDACVMYRWGKREYVLYEAPLTVPEGRVVLDFYALDAAGNTCPATRLEFLVDLTPPTTEILVEPDVGDLWYNEQPIVILISEPQARIYYSIDRLELKPYTGRIRIPSGEHLLSFYSVDAAGNREKERLRRFRIDLVNPEPRLLVNRTSVMTGEIVGFDASASIDSGSGVMGYRFSFGDGTSTGWVGGPAAPLQEHVYYQAGNYTVSLWVRDASGRESGPVSVVVNVAESAPSEGEVVFGPLAPLQERMVSHDAFPLAITLLVIGVAVALFAAMVRRWRAEEREEEDFFISRRSVPWSAGGGMEGTGLGISPVVWDTSSGALDTAYSPEPSEPGEAPITRTSPITLRDGQGPGGANVHEEIYNILKKLEEIEREERSGRRG